MNDTLLGLIDNHPSVVATSVADFAKKIEVSRATVYRWDTAMPKPEMLRRIADALQEPYAVVLQAALRSGGFIASAADMLAGLQVHVVNHGFNTREEWPVPVVAYADKEQAEKLAADDMYYALDGVYDYRRALTIAAVSPRPAERVFARYERGDMSRDFAKCVLSHRYGIGPSRFPDIEESDLQRSGAISEPFVVMRNGYVMRVEADAFSEASVRLVVQRIVELLADRLPPAGTDFGTIKDLEPVTDRPLPDALEISGEFHGEPSYTIAIDAVLSSEEIATAADAYRAARVVNAAAAEIIGEFDAACDRSEETA